MSKDKHILLVDDDRDICESVRDALEMEGYGVMAAFDGQEALELLNRRAERPCLILVDLVMPGMDGASLLKKLGDDYGLSHIPAIIFTASESSSKLTQAIRSRVHRIIRKPVEIDQLVSAVRDHCGTAVA